MCALRLPTDAIEPFKSAASHPRRGSAEIVREDVERAAESECKADGGEGGSVSCEKYLLSGKAHTDEKKIG